MAYYKNVSVMYAKTSLVWIEEHFNYYHWMDGVFLCVCSHVVVGFVQVLQLPPTDQRHVC